MCPEATRERHMIRHWLVLPIVFSVAFGGASALRGQTIQDQLNQFQATEETDRKRAFYGLLPDYVGDAGPATVRLLQAHPDHRDAITEALIALLSSETVRFQLDPPMRTPDADFDYLVDLVWAVASLKDVRAVDALLPTLGTGMIAVEGVAALGEAAIPGALQALETAGRYGRSGAARALGIMASNREELSLSDAAMTAIERGLLGALHDESDLTRRVTVRSLRPFSSDRVRKAMIELAQSDPDMVMRDGRPVYRVREEARAWLEHHRDSERRRQNR